MVRANNTATVASVNRLDECPALNFCHAERNATWSMCL